MKRSLLIMLGLAALMALCSCEVERTYTVASKRFLGNGEGLYLRYYVKKNHSEWKEMPIDGLEPYYEPGYEYVIRAKRITVASDHLDASEREDWLVLQEILAKERRESVGLPYEPFYYEDYIADPDGITAQYHLMMLYSSVHNISRIHVKTSDNQSSVTYSYAYDSDGRLSSVTYDDGQGDVREYVYTFYDDLLSCVVQGDVRYDYTFDGSRRILRMEKSSGGMIEKTYDYVYDGRFLSMIQCSDGSEWRYSTEDLWESEQNIVEMASYMDGIRKDVCRINVSRTANCFNVPVPGLSLPCFCDFTGDGFLTGRNPSFHLPFEISQGGQTRRFRYKRESDTKSDIVRIEYGDTVWELEYNDSYQWL